MYVQWPTEVRRDHNSLRNWSYKCLQATMWVLRTEFRPSTRVVGVLNPLGISLAPIDHLLTYKGLCKALLSETWLVLYLLLNDQKKS